MNTKKVLGLDIGTNSIGAALINLPERFEDYGEEGNIEWMGSRIIPLDGDYLQKFESGAQAETKAAFRRVKRGSRRLKHRYKLRRTRLIRVMKTLGWLNTGFPLDDSRLFKKNLRDGRNSLLINDYLPFSAETIEEFEKELGIEGNKSKKGKSTVPEDWIVYFLRKKALKKKIQLTELCRIIYMLNQRRGFKSSRKDLKDTNVLPYDEFIKRKEVGDFGENGIETQFVSITKIKSITFEEEKKDKKGTISRVYKIEAQDSRMDSWFETRRNEPDWAGKEFTFLVVQKVDKNGKLTQLKPQMPKENDWALCTTALSEKIAEKNQHPGEYFFNELQKAYREKRNYKIRQYPVYRWRYQKELKAIWEKQCELNSELRMINSDSSTLSKLAELLYPTQAKHNMPKLAEFQKNDLLHIISNDIIYYQRELRSQKNSINECRYEKRVGKEKDEKGEWVESGTYGLKCIPRSSPLFQEFRIWQDVHNIKIQKKEELEAGRTQIDVDVSALYITDIIKEKLFDLFQSKTSITEADILKVIKENNAQNDISIAKKGSEHSHKINLFVNRDTLKGNETLNRYRNLFRKAGFNGDDLLDDGETLLRLWHADYSITSSDEEKSKKGIRTALENLLPDRQNRLEVIMLLNKLEELKKEYGSYSACAIKKLLPVMRCGKYWKEEGISLQVKQRASQIEERLTSINNNVRRLNEIADDDVQRQVLKSFIGKENLIKGLNTYQAGYLLYDKHSEKEKGAVSTVDEFSRYIQKAIPNNSLRNPVVEQIVKETLLLVRDIWNEYGAIDEIHIELGRSLKNNSKDREKAAQTQKANFDEKQRIKKLLHELANDGFEQYVDANDAKPFELKEKQFKWETKVEKNRFEVPPNPESPVDIDKFRIWRNLSKQSETEWAKKIKDEKIPTEQEIKKYALWLSQNCRSPYTGRIIPLSQLFDKTKYEIEHVIPRKRMKNDGASNLVISEWGVNKAKDNSLGANFINDSKGKCKYGNTEYSLFTYEEYESYCKETFKFQKAKLKNMLATEVPQDFIERQLSDTRYIGRKLSELLAPVARNENGIIFTGGSITSELKNNWGLTKVWKNIVRPRFERLEQITGNIYIINDTDPNGNPVFHFNVKENPELDIKRIDHRHHALDALIIAATTREHIRYLNTLHAADTDNEIKKYRQSLVKGKIRDFKEPWEKFTEHAKNKLEELVVSFKVNNKIVSQPKNRTAYYKKENDKIKKEFREQKANPKWMSVRRSMFKEPQGAIFLKETYSESKIDKAVEIQIDRMLAQDTPKMRIAPYIYNKEARHIIRELIHRIGIPVSDKDRLVLEIKKHLKKNPLKDLSGKEYDSIQIAKFEEYAAKRVFLDKTFEHKKINKIPYAKNGKSLLGKMLHEHLDSEEFKNEKNHYDPALAFSNEGLEILAKKAGKPVTKVTIYEKKDESSKFGNQYVETDAGSNVFFVIYENIQTKEREGFLSVSTHKAIEKTVLGESMAETRDGFDSIILSPGDLVYLPTLQESNKIRSGIGIQEAIEWSNPLIPNRIYRMTDTTQGKCLFVPHRIASAIGDDGVELGSGNKSQRAWDGKVEYQPDSKGVLKRNDTGSMIKETCIKLKVDRLGNVQPVVSKK